MPSSSYSRGGRSSRRKTYTHGERSRSSHPDEQGFVCCNCSMYVSCDPLIAGVQNRNHCPYCLWSRHLDWRNAGDRLSSCRAGMEPAGLTTKRGKNKYASERDGELMIIHRCGGCAKLVINRIAADDSTAALFELFESSCEPSPAFQAELEALGVSILTAADRGLVRRRLMGGEAG